MHAACGFYNSGLKLLHVSLLMVLVVSSGWKCPDTLWVETIFQASYPDDFDTVWKHIGTKGCYWIHEPEPNHYTTEYPGHTKMYEAVTQYCGFPAIEAGKLGLAPWQTKR